MKDLKYINKYLYHYKSYLIWGTIFVVLANIFGILPAQIVRHSFDLVGSTITIYPLFKGSNSQDVLYQVFTEVVLIYGTVIVIMALVRGVFLFFMRQTIIVMSRLIEYDLKNEIYAHYQTLPLSFYRRNNTGDMMARISEDVGHVRMYLGPAIMYGLNAVGSFVLVLIYMIIVNPTLTFYAMLPMPILSVSIYYVNNIIHKRSTEIQQKLSEMSTFVQESFSGIRVLKAFVRENDFASNFAKTSNEYKIKALKLAMVNALFAPVVFGLIALSTVLTVYIGGLEVIDGAVTIGNIAEFTLYINMLVWPVTSLGWITSMTERAAASQKRINEFLFTKTDIVSSENLKIEILGDIEFKNVSLTYPDTGIKALKNISFSVKHGESLAILGSTGSGKSTIANLLCRLYDTTQGEILIDNHSIKQYNISTLRQQIGYVPQDVFLFSDSIKSNISFGAVKVTESQIIQAAKDADVYENILAFPKGFDTELGERGITLSGGQKQRVSIARAISRNPSIIILDDALSAVDTKTENAILNNLQRIMLNRTSIIISHRVSSAKLADKIIVLDEGKIIESGSHEELMLLNGTYKEMYEQQMQSEEEVLG
ncbi:MAG: ABC transporter ATP-binding protein/permease [Thermoflexibacter sp.]|nr:ABC transporter ATP-binding protein/permease [Thermoflexibacter sp.]